MSRLLVAIALLAVLIAPVIGCGRKAPPEPPPDSKFPRTYPPRSG